VGGKASNPGQGMDPAVEQGLLSNSNALTQIAQGQAGRADTLFNLTEPGLATAEQFYSKLASGDPSSIMQAIGPAVGQIQQGAAGATKSIMETAPAGGEKNLALANVQANKGSQVGGVATQAFLGAPNALAQIAGQGIGESISSASQGISGLSAGSQTLTNLGSLQFEEQQFQAQQKGSLLGSLGSLGQVGAAGIGGAMGGGGWEGALAAIAAF
jgi:hypothetical protein